jgi:hypothetical protein
LGTLRKKKNPLSPVVGLLIADESVCDPGKSIASIVASATALKACTRVPFLWNALQNAQSFVWHMQIISRHFGNLPWCMGLDASLAPVPALAFPLRVR